MRRVLAGLCLVALTACGGSSNDLSDRAASVLQRDADALATAARAGNAAGVRAAWAQLQKDVAAQRAAGDLTADRATRVLAAGKVVATDVVGAALVAPKPTPVATRAPARTVEEPERGKGKGKGNDRDDDD